MTTRTQRTNLYRTTSSTPTLEMVLTRRGGGVDVLVAPAPAPAPQVFQATYSTAELEVLKGQQLRNIAKVSTRSLIS